MADTVLDRFFGARHVVVLGASAREGSLGHRLADNLLKAGYDGRLDFVNPSGGTIRDRPIAADLDAVEGAPDLAVIIVPARAVPDAMAACGRRGVRRAIVASGGFRETGKEGADLERRVLDVARRHGMRVVGPNCVGLIAPEERLDTSFLGGPPAPAGGVGMISQSGALCAAVVDWARADGVGFSRLISLGNQVDVDESDALEALAGDDRTRVAALYLEGVADGPRFVRAAAAASRRKPVVVMKVGRSVEGIAAARSHTGALAGSDRAFDAALRRAGALRAATTQDLFDFTRVFAQCPLPAGPRLAIVTNAGGPGVAAVDAAATEGLAVARFDAATTRSLRDVVPQAGSAANPVDLLASASPSLYGRTMQIVLESTSVDGVVVLLPPPPGHPAEAVAEELARASALHRKPVLVALMGSAGIEAARRVLQKHQIPVFRYPEQAVRAFARLAERVAIRHPEPAETPDVLPRPALPDTEGWMSAAAAFALVDRLGVPVVPVRFAGSQEDAVHAASETGYPVALKIEVDGVVHKRAEGGLALSVGGAEGVRQVWRGFSGRFGPRMRGVVVQPMTDLGEQAVLGVVRDSQFGALLMLGGGGSYVEADADVAFALCPAPVDELSRLLAGTRFGRRIRNHPAHDRFVEAAARLSAFAAAFPRVAELDLNPVVLTGDRAAALDVRVRLTKG